MELLAKIFTIIGTIFGAVFIVPIVFGFIALNKIAKHQYTVTIAVLTLIFCNPVAGILMIVLAKKNPTTAPVEEFPKEKIEEPKKEEPQVKEESQNPPQPQKKVVIAKKKEASEIKDAVIPKDDKIKEAVIPQNNEVKEAVVLEDEEIKEAIVAGEEIKEA